MGMKRNNKKPSPTVETLTEAQRPTWKSKYEQICASHMTNGVSSGSNSSKEEEQEEDTRSSALDGLCGYLSSEDSSGNETDLNDEVEAFLKEVDDIYDDNRDIEAISNTKKSSKVENMSTSETTLINSSVPTTVDIQAYMQAAATGALPISQSAPTVAWQECFDSTTGYTYYWNMVTNEVTWTTPPEYQTYAEALAEWQKYHAEQATRAQLQQQQQHLQLQQPQQTQQQLYTYQNQVKEQVKQHLDSRNPMKTASKKRKSNINRSDSEDEKIELITSYGPNSGDESSSDQDKKLDKKPILKKKKKKKLEIVTSNEIQSNTGCKRFGPELPTDSIKSDLEPSIKKKALISTSLVPYNPDCDSESEETLGGNCKLNFVPDKGPPGLEGENDVNNRQNSSSSPSTTTTTATTTSTSTTSKEIINNNVKKMVSSESQMSTTNTTVPVTSSNNNPIDSKSLVPSYGHDSDQEQETAGKNRSNEALSKRVKVKLSARGRELINTSLTTAKARATDFVETSDGLKPIDSVPDEQDGSLSPLITDSKKKFDAVNEMKSAEFAFNKEDSSGSSFTDAPPPSKKAKFEAIQFVKAEILLLSEKTNLNGSTTTTTATAADATAEVDEDSNSSDDVTFYIKDQSSLLMDKMKFLSAGKEAASPVQIWTIQLETLLSAWESKHLNASYLKLWLESTSKELLRLETSVAPEGWLCTWSRYDKHCHNQLVTTNLLNYLFCLVFPNNIKVHSAINNNNLLLS